MIRAEAVAVWAHAQHEVEHPLGAEAFEQSEGCPEHPAIDADVPVTSVPGPSAVTTAEVSP